MPDSKHTPGPWGWQMFGSSLYLVGQHSMRPIVLGVRKGVITARTADDILRPLTPDHPDARLIAAAPTLLTALQVIATVTDSEHTVEFVRGIANAALARLTPGRGE